MGLFGSLVGLFASSKIHDSIDDNHDDSFLEDAFEVGVSSVGGKVVKDVVDDLFDWDDEEW